VAFLTVAEGSPASPMSTTSAVAGSSNPARPLPAAGHRRSWRHL